MQLAKMTIATHSLLAEVLDAHGGVERWHTFTKVSAKVVTGGYLWGMKGIPIDETPRTMTSELRRQWTRTEPFGDADWHMTYQPDRVVIETRAGAIIAQQDNPRQTFAGHAWETLWTPVQLGYFNGYAMWTYYNVSFLIGEPGFEVTEIPSITDIDRTSLRGLRVRFPTNIHTHSREQRLYFDEHGLLRRHDYEVDVAGQSRAAHLISEYVDVHGLKFPTKRRVYMRNEDGTLDQSEVVVCVDLYDIDVS